MTKVKEGDTIRIHYTGRLEDGAVFDSSESGKPLEFTVGEGEVVAGLEKGVVGMSPGESKVIVVPMEQAYGPRTEKRVCELDKKKVPDTFHPEIGQQLQMYRADGLPVMGTVIGISETSLTMDYNHPLAGRTLIFDTRLLEIL
jgi:FKBP-type peptidyl-prolyl cis-trans isomerase 2